MSEPQKIVGETALSHFWEKLRMNLDDKDERISNVQDRLAENTQAITNEELEEMLK